MQETSGALFLKTNFLSYALLFGFAAVIVPFTTIYASLKSHKSDHSIDVLNLIGLLGLLFSSLPDWWWTSTHLLVINLGISLAQCLISVRFFGTPLLYEVKTISSHQ